MKFESVGLPASSNDYISRNVRKTSVFGVVPKGNTVNFTYREINVTWIIMTVQKKKQRS